MSWNLTNSKRCGTLKRLRSGCFFARIGPQFSSSKPPLNNAHFRPPGDWLDQELGLYYLKSRYYDPEVCRFINADKYVSNGDGIIGHNMFAYCLNNPVVFTDEGGESSAPFWFFLFMNSEYGLVHRLVQIACVAQKPGSVMEVGVLRENGFYGRADILYNDKVWEVKHKASKPLALPQAKSYVGGKPTHGPVITGLGDAETFKGSFIINCMGESYEVTFSTPADGVVLYDVQQKAKLDLQPDYTYLPFAPQGERLKEGYVRTVHIPTIPIPIPIPVVPFSFGHGGSGFPNMDYRLC